MTKGKMCPRCGKSMGGFAGYWTAADESRLAPLREQGVDIPHGLCRTCSIPYLEQKEKPGETSQAPTFIPDISIYTFNPYKENTYQNVGLASAHVALGTGLISQIASSWTDFLGAQSETYSKKMTEAEGACLAKLKIRAHTMGADAVIGMHTTYTELTSGRGMLMVCMTGTAVKKAK